MNKKLLGLGLSVALSVTSCQTDNFSNAPTEEEVNNQEFFQIVNAGTLKSSISIANAGVIGIRPSSTARNSDAVANIALEEIAEIIPPEINGQPLRANHVDVKGNFAYVAYTKEGATYLGGIDIIDISDAHNPKVVHRLLTSNADINALYINENDYLIFTGASHNPAGTNKTILGYIKVENGQFTNIYDLDIKLPGQTGVDVIDYNGITLLFSGSDGIIGYYGLGGRATAFTENTKSNYPDLRSAAFNNNKLAVLSGEFGLMNMDYSNSFSVNLLSSINTPELGAESKRTISWYGDNVLVAQGASGVGIYNFEQASSIENLPINFLAESADVTAENKVTNAVSTDDNYIFMANGGAGLDIFKLDDNFSVVAEGITEIAGSANYVKAKGDFLYLASGTGLRILKMSEAPVTNDAFLDCASFVPYSGNNNLNVNSNSEVSYSGSTTLKHLNVSGLFNYCGALNIEKSININSNGEFNMSGALSIGNNKNGEKLNLNSGSVLRINGSLVIYGDLNLNSGATLEFVGEDSRVYVTGRVRINSGATVTGNFIDENNKF